MMDLKRKDWLAFTFGFLLFISVLPLRGQNPSDSSQNSIDNIFRLNAREVLKLDSSAIEEGQVISSVSGRAENEFEVPVGASFITYQDIKAAGCLHITEALRLLSGLIVRETSAGNYDVNIRGLSNLPPASDFNSQDSRNILIMINNRPFFSYFLGGVLWESLPIDLHDVLRIELIRGPMAALYGPNALAGVINIITQKPTKQGAFFRGDMQYGNFNSIFTRAAYGAQLNSRVSIWGSSHFIQRDRHSEDFYGLSTQVFTQDPRQLVNYQTGEVQNDSSFKAFYPDPSLALRKWGSTINGAFIPLKGLEIDLSLGLEQSQSLRVYSENGYTPLSTVRSSSWYLDANAHYKKARFNFSLQKGEQEPGVNVLGSHYDFQILDLGLELPLQIKNLLIQPSLSLRKAVYDDRNYFSLNPGPDEATGLLNARQELDDYSASLLTDWNGDKFRILGSVRLDKFNVPDDVYFSYLGVFNWKVNQKNIFRVSYAKANRSPFFSDIFSNYRSQLTPTPNPDVLAQLLIQGNSNLSLLINRTLEIAHRWKFGNNWQAEIEGFWSRSQDYNRVVQSNQLVLGLPSVFIASFNQQNIDLESEQIGFTFSLEKRFQKGKFRIFTTYQRSNLKNYSPFGLEPGSDPSGMANISIQSDVSNFRASPSLFGGAYVFLDLSQRFKLALQAYGFSSQEISHLNDVILEREISFDEIKAKFLLNAKVSYQLAPQLGFFLNIRNIVGQNSREYYFTDPTRSMVLLGLDFEL